jgi:hypothetical protein
MVWLYPPSNNLVEDDGYNCFFIGVYWGAYLEDYNLTMPLAVKYQVWLQPDCIGDGFIHAYDDTYAAKSINPLRAICIVLVMIAMEVDHGM